MPWCAYREHADHIEVIVEFGQNPLLDGMKDDAVRQKHFDTHASYKAMRDDGVKFSKLRVGAGKWKKDQSGPFTKPAPDPTPAQLRLNALGDKIKTDVATEAEVREYLRLRDGL